MSRQTIEWDNWIGHDLGRRAPNSYHYGRRKLLASYSHWRGLNAMRYLNGSVGPRPGFYPVPMAQTNFSGFFGTIVKVLWVGGLRQVCMITSNGGVFVSPDYTGTPAWTRVGNLGFTPTCAAVNGNTVFVGSLDTGGSGTNPPTCLSAYVDVNALTITPITNMPKCNQMVSYNQFIVVANTGSVQGHSGTLWFSDLPANLSDLPGTSWASSQGNGVGVVGVGTAERISGLFTQKDTVVIAKQGGEWYTMSGIPSGPPIIRRMDIGLDYKGVGGAVRQSNIWYPNGRDIGTFTGSGVQITELPDLDDFGGTTKYDYVSFTGLCQLSQADEFMLAGTAKNALGFISPWIFIRHGLAGVATAPGWSRHSFQYNNGLVAAGTPLPLYVGDSVVWLFMQVSTTNAIDVFQFDVRQEIPYQKTGGAGANFPHGNPQGLYADAQSGGVVTSSMSIPEWWSPDGHNAHVHEVFVDLDYDAAAWQNASDNGTNPSNVVGFDMNVEAINLKSADNKRTSLNLTWGPKDLPRPVPSSNTNMTRTRAYFRVGDQGASSGFKINLNNMRGIQVYRILATVDVSVSEP